MSDKAKEFYKNQKIRVTYEPDGQYAKAEDVFKAMESYHKHQMSKELETAYICKRVNGEDAVVIAENIAEVFDKLEDITPNPEEVEVSGTSVKIYY